MTMKNGIMLGSTGVAALVGAALLFVSPSTPAQTVPVLPTTPTSTVAIISYQLVSEVRVSRTVSDFTYRAIARNSGPTILNVTGIATSLVTTATLPDNALLFGELQPGAIATSADTFVVRQDRTVPFNAGQLRWQMSGTLLPGLPPDPGPANNLTLAGIDFNDNGVRDDVERIIFLQFSGTPDFAKAMEFAKLYQQRIAAPTPTNRHDALVVEAQEVCATEGASDRFIDYDWEGLMENTPARLSAIRAFERVLIAFNSNELLGLASCLN